MAKKERNWVFAVEAAEIMSCNNDRKVSTAYVLARAHEGKIRKRRFAPRVNLYCREDIEAWRMGPKRRRRGEEEVKHHEEQHASV